MVDWADKLVLLFRHYDIIGLFLLSFAEAAFLPVTPSLLLIPLVLAKPALAPAYAFAGASGAILGGLLGYAIGFRLGRPMLTRFSRERYLETIEKGISRYGGWAILASGLTPLSYQVFTICAGIFRMPLYTFIPATIVGRSLHFLGETLLLATYGPQIVGFVRHSLGMVRLLILIAGIGLFLLIWRLPFFQDVIRPRFQRWWDGWRAWVIRREILLRSSGYLSVFLICGAVSIVLGALLFGRIARELMEHELAAFDQTWSTIVFSWRRPWLTSCMRAVTFCGAPTIIAGLTLLVFILRHFLAISVLDSRFLLLEVGGALGLNEALKYLFHRSRPALPWLTHASGFSFPSGHTFPTAAFYWFLLYLLLSGARRQTSPWFYVLIIAIGLIPIGVGISRVYLGVHYPSDVLGGWAIGAAWAGLWTAGSEILKRRKAAAAR